MSAGIILKSGLLAGAAVGTIWASSKIAFETTKHLGRLIYPMSKLEGVDMRVPNDMPDSGHSHRIDFIIPNMGFRVHEKQYNALSTMRKVANLAAVVFCGAAIGALSGGSILGLVGLTFYSGSAVAIAGLILGSISGAITGALLDPEVMRAFRK